MAIKNSKCINIDGILSSYQASSANTANTITLSTTTQRYRFYGFNCIISGAASVNAITITVTLGGTTKFYDALPVGTAIGNGISKILTNPIEATAIGQALVITASAGGASVVTNISLLYDLV
ncbi:MAG: hypothetical protein RLY43_1902 [Bacteroidota bacterium]|jgi:hypothetical protein